MNNKIAATIILAVAVAGAVTLCALGQLDKEVVAGILAAAIVTARSLASESATPVSGSGSGGNSGTGPIVAMLLGAGIADVVFPLLGQ